MTTAIAIVFVGPLVEIPNKAKANKTDGNLYGNQDKSFEVDNGIVAKLLAKWWWLLYAKYLCSSEPSKR